MGVLGKISSWGGAVKFALALLAGSAVGYGAANLVGFLVPRICLIDSIRKTRVLNV